MAVLYIRYSENQRSAAYLRFYRNRNDGRNDYYLSRRGGGLDSDTDKIGYYDDFADRFYPNYSSINISLTAGDDVVTFDRNQRIRTYIFGKGGSDTLVFNADYGENLTINLNDGDSAYDETRVTFTSIENVTGGPRNDVLTGTDQANRINGGRGNDTLRGGNGNDQLDGGIGSDTLSGGNGDDVISMGDRTGEDIDTANGGAGADLFLVVDRDGTPSPRQPEADIFNPSMVISALDSLYGKTKLIGAGNPLIAMALSVGTDVAAQWLRQIISSGGAASEPNYAKEDYVQITDFNPVEDMFIYKTESTGAWFNNDMGKIQYHADSNTNNTGGLLAVLTIDDDLVEKIRLETKMSDISVRERLSRSQSLQTLYLRKNSSGKAEIQLPGQNFRSVEGIVSQDGLNENETRWKNSVIQAANAYVENSSPGDIVIVTGAFSSAIIQGEDLPDDNTQRLMSGTRFGDVFYSRSRAPWWTNHLRFWMGWGRYDVRIQRRGCVLWW
jgi:hypothetical protein